MKFLQSASWYFGIVFGEAIAWTFVGQWWAMAAHIASLCALIHLINFYMDHHA